jgi:membrane protein
VERPSAKRTLTIAHLGQLFKKSWNAWVDDYAASMGAALAYYTVFSLAPLLLLVIAVAGLVFGVEAARGEIVGQLRGLIGDEGAVAVQGLLKSASAPTETIWASIIGVATLIAGATSVFAELQSSLDRIWRAPAAAQRTGIVGLIRSRVLSFGLIVSIGFLLLVSLVVSAALAALGKWWGPMFGAWETVLQIVNLVVSFGFVTVLFALIYRILPRVRVAWDDVWMGAAVTAVLFTVGKFGIGLYLGKAGVTSGFGAAGSIVVLLVWVYYSAQIFLLGAEFTWVYAHDHGSKVGEPVAAAPAVPKRSEAARPTAAAALAPSTGAAAACQAPPQATAPVARPWGDAFVTALVAIVWGTRAMWQRRRTHQ